MSHSPLSPSPDPRLRSLRTIALAMMAAPVMLGVVVTVIFSGPDRFAMPPTWLPLAQVAVAIAIFILCETRLYRAPTISRGTDAQRAEKLAADAYMAMSFQRLAVCELLAMLSLAAAFVLQPPTVMAYVPGGILAVVLLAVHVYPNNRTVAKTRASLEREGVPAPLF